MRGMLPEPTRARDDASRLDALRRIALAAARPVDDGFVEHLVAELADAMPAPAAFVAVFADDSQERLRTLAMRFGGRAVENIEYPVVGSPCEQVIGREFRYIAAGVLPRIDPQNVFAHAGMDSYAAFPLTDSQGAALGVLAVLDAEPIAGGDAAHAEVMLKIAAGRLSSELERRRTLEMMQRAALAVSAAQGESVFDELVRMLASLLGLEYAFIARTDPDDPEHLHLLALHADGCIVHDLRYALASAPCREVLGQQFRAYPSGLAQLFPDDADVLRKGAEGYAGHPLTGHDGEALGVIAVGSRRPLANLGQVEAMLKIFALRAAAEVERQRTLQALRRSEASYRTIFDSAAGAIFVHDWDSFALLDVNRRACEEHGRSREELLAIDPAELMAGDPPHDVAHAVQHLMQARLDRCPPFEWKVRLADGTLRWWEMHLKPALLDGRRCILAFSSDITERKAAEDRLRASEEQHRTIFNGSVDGLVVEDAEQRIVDINEAYLQMHGYARADVIGRRMSEFVPPDLQAQCETLVPQILEGTPCHFEGRTLRRDGSTFDVEIHGVQVVYGGQARVLVVMRDITERKTTEARLRAREEQYRAIFDGSVDQMVLWNRRLEVVDVNTAFERNTGMSRASVVGRHWSERPDADEMAGLLPMVQQALHGVPSHAIVKVSDGEGRLIDLEVRYGPVRIAGETHVLGVGRNVTDRIEREHELQRSAARLRATVEAAFDCVIGMDGEGRIVEFNGAAERVFGHRRAAVLGRPLGELIIPERHRDAHRRGLRHFVPGSTTSAMLGRLVETTALTADGREIPVEMAISVAAVPEGNIFVGHLRDISARRAAESERAQLEAQLRQAQKMEAIGQLTGGIAHDFNNILTSVLGYTAMAQERAGALADAKLQRQLGQARLATERARDLVAQMLAFARRKPGARRALDLAPLLRQSVGLLRPTLPSSLLIEVRVDGDDAALAQVEADAVQLEQVLFNLCINARDAVAGAGHVRVGLRAADGGWRCRSCGLLAPRGRWLELSVEDDGSGIDEDTMRRMFDPFFTTKPAGSGSGMGLAMVHGIVHDHGGHIAVRSSPGRGARFGVLLPACATAPGMTPALPAAADAAPAQPALRGRVLVVEDDELAGNYLAERLADWGLAVTLERDARDALACIEDGSRPIDLLLTDLTMPHLSGLALAERATALRPGLPVLLASGDLGAADAQALSAAGVRATLAKPLDSAELLRVIRAALAPA